MNKNWGMAAPMSMIPVVGIRGREGGIREK
jgi:hypothetical protein